ncbi:DUF6056 family protein [Streptomyces sp. NPDC016469]|uniref:DUF6056 family protein n=1 Tax=Streptomyces sp. NPDC016469 TaxID=3157191 RepID=UPI0033F471E3
MTAETPKAAGTPRPPGTAAQQTRRATGRKFGAPFWAAVLAVFPLGLLGAAMWIGRLVRPGGDDWCFLPVLRDDGVAGMIGKFYLHDNGRIANALMVAAYGAFGVAGHQWFAAVSGVLILAAVWALVAAALRRAGRTAPRGIPLLTTSMIVAVFLFSTPNTYKTYYWPASSVSHTLAPALAAAAVIPFLRARTRRGHTIALCVCALAGLFIGTLSEGTAITAGVLLCTVLLLSFRSPPGLERTRTRRWCGVALAALLLAGIILYTSPGSRARRSRFNTGATSMTEPQSLGAALRTFSDILGTVVTTWTYLGALAVGVLLGVLLRAADARTDGPQLSRPFLPAAAGAAALLVAGYLCTLITLPAFRHNLMTYGTRTWNDYLFVYVLLLTAVGALLGRALRDVSGYAAAFTVGAALLCVATCVGLAIPLLGLERDMAARAAHWDKQDQVLREGAQQGAEVLPYVPASVGHMRDPFGNHGRKLWPATCVADFYHLKRITYATD